MRETATASNAASLLLAGAMCFLPFLVPYHQLPVLSFYPEWLAAALGVCAALAVLVRHDGAPMPMPVPALWLLGFALYLLARMADPGQAYPQISLLAALYVLFAVLMMWLGAQLARTLGVERVALVLAAFLLAGALVNALAGVIQFCGRPALLEDVVAQLYGSRAYGNIAQPNLYANYLALGQCALLFLWLRGRLRTAYAVPFALLLAVGSALSGSRGALVFAGWIALVGAMAGRVLQDQEARRLKLAAYGVAGVVVVAHLAVPWVNAALDLASAGAFERLGGVSGQVVEPRWQIYLLGLRVFASAPVFGVGIGGFAGAAFELGLEPSLTRTGEVLTSPHDLPLHLLGEAGIAGAVPAFYGLYVWGRQFCRGYVSNPRLASWWIAAAAGVELIHSLFEFPLWSANFLGVTALLLGAGSAADAPSRPPSRANRMLAAGSCAVLALALAALFRDYIRLDTTRITGSAITLASPADARRDAAVLRGLGNGLLAPLAELWMVSGATLDRTDLADKLAMSARVASFWPSNAVLVREAAFLALDGDEQKGLVLLGRALQTFPHLRPATIAILESAPAGDEAALGPLLVAARRQQSHK